MVTGNTLDSARELEGFGALNALVLSEYEHVTKIEDFDVYLRRPVAAAANGR
jgi:hypothetical protein